MASLQVKPSTTSSSSPDIFKEGSFGFKRVETSSTPPPPKPLLIFTPTKEGTYPVLLFLHGFRMVNSFYSKLLQHITSHGFICVAPQLYNIIFPPTGPVEIESVVDVTNWLSDGLQLVLPEKVEADLKKLALAGHSRGGKAAFSIALGHGKPPVLKFSALIGLDPVAAEVIVIEPFPLKCKEDELLPKILTKKPNSFNLGIPVMVLGTGLGSEKANFMPCPCAPKGWSHKEFYYECKPPCYHFVPSDYGHMDMLDDCPSKVGDIICKGGEGCKDFMRRCVGGIVVAFLRAYLESKGGDLEAIINDPSIAPVKLDPIEHRL